MFNSLSTTVTNIIEVILNGCKSYFLIPLYMTPPFKSVNKHIFFIFFLLHYYFCYMSHGMGAKVNENIQNEPESEKQKPNFAITTTTAILRSLLLSTFHLYTFSTQFQTLHFAQHIDPFLQFYSNTVWMQPAIHQSLSKTYKSRHC